MVLVLYIVLICYLAMFNDFLPKTEFGTGIPDIDFFRATSYLLLLGCMFHWSIKKDIRFFNRWIISILIFYTIVFASITWSNFSYDVAILRHLFDTTFIPFFIALVGINLFKKQENVKIYILNIIIAAFILSIVSVIQMGYELSKGADELRATGTFTNPNRLAIMLVLTIPCLLYAKENLRIPKIIWWIVTIAVISGIISSVSRKGIITMILCFGLYHLLKRNYRKVIYTFILFAAISGVLSGVSIVSGRFERTSFTGAFESKWAMTEAGLRMFTTKPIIGLGFEGYKDHYREYFPGTHRLRYDAHNIFVTALANYGIIGFIGFMSIFLIPLIAAFKFIRNKNENIDTHSSEMAIICLTSVIPFMVNGWFAGALFYSGIEVSLFYSNICLFLAVSGRVENKY